MSFSDGLYNNINTVSYRIIRKRDPALADKILTGWSIDDEYGTGTLYLYIMDKYPAEWAAILPDVTSIKLTGGLE